MESLVFQYLPINAVFTFLIFLLVLVKLIISSRNKHAQNLPPGPRKLPIIGNLHQLIGSLPHHRLGDLARIHGPVMHIKLGELSQVVVSSAEAAQQIMRTHDSNFVQRPVPLSAAINDHQFQSLLFAPYGEYWRQMRRITSQELLSPGSIRSFGPMREEEVSKLVKDLSSASGSIVNLSEKLFSLTYGITAKAAFGEKCKDQELFISIVKEGIKSTAGLSVSELFPSQNWLHWITGFKAKCQQRVKKSQNIIENIVKERMSARTVEKAADVGSKSKCLLDVLLDLQGNGDLAVPIETKNIKAVLKDIFIAAGDSSSTAMEWTMLEMLKNPRVMEKAQAEVRRVFERERNVNQTRLHDLSYLKLIIKESLRLHPPAPLLLPRESIEHCVINGHEIPAKTKVLVNAWAIGRDQRYWTEPEKFYPERFIDNTIDFKGTNFEFIPFGAGRRMCPGMAFAMAGMELPLAQLLFHFDWKLPNGTTHEDLDMTESFGLTARRKEDLHVIPISCQNSTSIFY